jgi:hypothetical protein
MRLHQTEPEVHSEDEGTRDVFAGHTIRPQAAEGIRTQSAETLLQTPITLANSVKQQTLGLQALWLGGRDFRLPVLREAVIDSPLPY